MPADGALASLFAPLAVEVAALVDAGVPAGVDVGVDMAAGEEPACQTRLEQQLHLSSQCFSCSEQCIDTPRSSSDTSPANSDVKSPELVHARLHPVKTDCLTKIDQQREDSASL